METTVPTLEPTFTFLTLVAILAIVRSLRP